MCVGTHLWDGDRGGYFNSHHSNTISSKDYATASTHQKHFPLPIILQDFEVWPSTICHLLSTLTTLVTSICWFSHHILIRSLSLINSCQVRLSLINSCKVGRIWKKMVMTSLYDLEERMPQISHRIPRSLDMAWIMNIQQRTDMLSDGLMIIWGNPEW